MGIFRVEKKNLDGQVEEVFEFPNTILDVGLEYLCSGPNADFNTKPAIAVGVSDITPDTNQKGLISPVLTKAATFAAGTSTTSNPQGDKQFQVTAHFNANEAIGDLTEISYIMNTDSNAVLNRTLFQVAGQLDTRFSPTPELDQIQNTDVTNLNQVYGTDFFDQTFTPTASSLVEIELSLASSGNPPDGLHVAVYSDNGSGRPGTLLGSTQIAAFSEPVQRWRSATFSPILTTVPGSAYHLVVSSPGTDQANCYDLFGSASDIYSGGQLLSSSDSGTTYAAVNPAQDMGFKTYYSTTGAAAHDYVLTFVQFDKETAVSGDMIVNQFPENNLDSTNTSQGTVRLTLPTYVELPPFTQALKIYKKVGATYELLQEVGTVRQYYYDNGTITPTASAQPPAASSVTFPVGLSATLDTVNGGPLVFSQNKFYKVSSILQGPPIFYQTSGPYQDNTGDPGGVKPFYDSAYTTQTLPFSAYYYETAPSAEYTLNAPSSGTGSFNEYFSSTTLDTSLWQVTNNNTDYFNILKLSSTGENQLQLNTPAGVPFVIASTKEVRPSQSYYINFTIPWLSTPKPFYINPATAQVNPIYTDSATNRIAICGFANPNNINSMHSDKRLWLEIGYYHHYRTETMLQADQNQYASTTLLWSLYDNTGNQYFFNFNDIKPSHSDGAYTLKIDILQDGTMQISWLDSSSRTFRILNSSFMEFNFTTQYNAQNTYDPGYSSLNPGPTTQTTKHFLVPSNYSFALGNPSNDGLAQSIINVISVDDSIYTLPGTNPTVPVPAVAMRSSGFGATLSWNNVPGARKYRIYSTSTSGDYSAVNGALVYDYNVYYPAYAVQSTESANNDWYNQIAGCGGSVRNWVDLGVTYGIETVGTGNNNIAGVVESYALAGFVGSYGDGYWGGPTHSQGVPTIVTAHGAAEGYLLQLNALGQVCMFTFMGGGFEIVAQTGPSCAIGSLWIDGNYVKDIDFYSADVQECVSVFRTDVLTPGKHFAQIRMKNVGGQPAQNDFALPGSVINLDYFHITVPAIVDPNTLQAGNPLAVNDSNIAPVPPPTIKGAKTYNGNGPTVVVKDPQHTLDVTMVFSLINPNL